MSYISLLCVSKKKKKYYLTFSLSDVYSTEPCGTTLFSIDVYCPTGYHCCSSALNTCCQTGYICISGDTACLSIG